MASPKRDSTSLTHWISVLLSSELLFTPFRLEKYSYVAASYVKFVGAAVYDPTSNTIFHLLTWGPPPNLHLNCHDALDGSITRTRYAIYVPFKYVYSAAMYQHDSPNDR